MKILVTGGAGFIASHISDAFLAAGHEVVILDDLVEGILRLLRSDEPLPVNIGNPREMTVLQFAKLIIELVGSKSGIAFKPLPVDDPKVRQPDITKARRVLNNWEPTVPVEEGLKRTIEYFRTKVAA